MAKPMASNGRNERGENDVLLKDNRQIEEWDKNQTDNFFVSDLGFQRSLEFHLGSEKYKEYVAQLIRFGAQAARVVDPLVRKANLAENLPKLKRFNNQGERIEDVIFHPNHHEAGRIIYESGMMSLYEEPGNNLVSLALFYLSSQNGEAGHNWAVASTAGVIEALRALGSKELKDRFLSKLLDPDINSSFRGAQFLTENQGEPGVGPSTTIARPIGPNRPAWLLSGEKRLCSNPTADLALVTAQVSGQGEGADGLGLFLLPRRLEGGRLNNIFIHKLLDKLSMGSKAVAEVELRDAEAYQLGPLDKGFQNMMTYAVKSTNVFNAVGTAGIARRAYITARSYAESRSAFGRPLIHLPIIQDLLANMRADASAMLSGAFQIINLIDQIDVGQGSQEAEGFLRMALKLNRYRSSMLAHEAIMRAIEVLGSSGIIESYSVLPRLLRDSIGFDNWEGAQSILVAQVQRDIRRHQVQIPFFKAVEGLINNVNDEAFRRDSQELADKMRPELDAILDMDELTAAIYFRPYMDRLTDLYYSACLASEGAWETTEKKDRTKMRLASLFFNRRAAKKEPKDVAYYDDLVSRLC